MGGCWKIKLEINALNNNTKNLLEETLNNKDLINKLNEVLEEKNSILKISVDDKNKIKIEEVKNEPIINEPIINKKINEKSIDEVKNKEVSKLKKITKSFLKVFEEFFDSVAKNFLKKKYKINNSVYNDGKKAVIAIRNKDSKNFFKKATDAILNMTKKLSTEKKKIIKNTKNVAIDEIYSWKG